MPTGSDQPGWARLEWASTVMTRARPGGAS